VAGTRARSAPHKSMQLECRYTFHLPPGNRLLVRRSRGDSPEEWRFATDRSDVTVILEIPASESGGDQDAPLRIARNEHEGWEVWQLAWLKVYVLTEEEHPWPQGLPDLQRDRQIDLLAEAAASGFLRAVRWRHEQYWLPDDLTLSTAGASVEYYQAGERIPHGRIQGTARVPAIETALSESSGQTIEEDLRKNRQATLPEVLLLDAMLYRRVRDYRVALMLAAFSLEMALIKLLKTRLGHDMVASKKDIERLERVSNRFLSTVLLGLLHIGDGTFRQRCGKVFDLRNQVVHGKRESVTPEEAANAIDAAKMMLGFVLENTSSTSP
jgi:hypothetical protein